MNKLIKYFIISLLITNNAIAKQCFSKKSYIKYHYVNGVNVPEMTNHESMDDITNRFEIEEIKLLYNPTLYQGSLSKILTKEKTKFSATKYSDFIELANIGINISLLSILDGGGMLGSTLNDTFFEVLPQKILESIELDFNKNLKYPTLYNHAKIQLNQTPNKLLDKLDKDKYNLIFAHSQGNLVANTMCANKGQLNIDIISIASPGGITPCNRLGTYALFSNDHIINLLKNSLTNVDKVINLHNKRQEMMMDSLFVQPSNVLNTPNINAKFLKPNFYDHTNDLLHHYLNTYLNDFSVLAHLTEKLAKTQELIYEEKLNFPFLSLKIEYDKNDFNQKIERTKLARKYIDSFIISYYMTHTYYMDNAKHSRHRINFVYEEWDAILDAQFTYPSKEIHSMLLKYSLPVKLAICNRYGNRFLPFYKEVCKEYKNSPKRNMASEFDAPKLMWLYENKEYNLDLSCKDVFIGKSNLRLEYISNTKKDQKISLVINEEINPTLFNKTKKVQRSMSNLANLEISEGVDGVISYKLNDFAADKDSSIKEGKQNINTKCNTYRKLFTAACSQYYRDLESM